MIAVPAGGRVLVWSSPVDFRKGMDGLCAYVQLTLKADAFAGDLFVFRSRRADRIKVLMIFPRSGGHLSKLGMIRAEVMDGEYSTGIHG